MVSLLYFRCQQLGDRVVDVCPKTNSPQPKTTSGVRAFIGRRRGLHVRAPCQSTVSSDSHLQIGHWWSDQRHLVVSGTGNLQFQGRFVPISWRAVLELFQLTSRLLSGHDACIQLPHLVGVSASI